MNLPRITKQTFIRLFAGLTLTCTTHLAAQESPYADGFPPPAPNLQARTKIKLTRDPQGLLFRSEEGHQESADRTQDYFKSKYLVKMRKHYPDQDATVIKFAPRPPADGLDPYENVVYARWGERAMVLDLYLPSEHEEPLSLVVFIHGGGWEHGSHRGYRPAAMAFAKRGFATATVEYRLAGEAMFPAAIYDVKAAIRWLRASATEYHLDPNRFGITGGSAGGNIAVLTAVTFGDSRFEGPANHLEQSSEIQCVVSMYGAMSWTAPNWTRSEPGSHLMNETLPDFHIANGANLPPILFLNEWDRRKDRRWGAHTMDIIKKIGKEELAELTLFNAPHGFILFFPHQALALDHLESFFGKHLRQTRE
jgi:acetyl esterase/lipase